MQNLIEFRPNIKSNILFYSGIFDDGKREWILNSSLFSLNDYSYLPNDETFPTCLIMYFLSMNNNDILVIWIVI